LSNCDNSEGLCCIAMSFNGYFTLWHSSWLTYVKLLHSPMVMLNCDVHQGLCWIMKLRGWLQYYVTLWHNEVYNMVISILMFTLVELCWRVMFLNGYVALQHSPRVMLDFFPKSLCHIATLIFADLCQIAMFLNGYVTLWHSSNVMPHSVCLTIVDHDVHGWTWFTMNNHVDYGWAWLTLYHIATCILASYCRTDSFLNDYFALRHSLMVMLHCDIMRLTSILSRTMIVRGL